MRTYHLALIAALVSGGVLPDFAQAQDQNLEQRINDLDLQIKAVQERLGTSTSSPNLARPISQNPPGGEAFAGRSGFAIGSPDGAFILRFGGVLQADGRFYSGSGTDVENYTPSTAGTVLPSQFLLRRARPILSGTLYNTYYFFFQPDFGNNTTAIYDAYLDIRPWSYANLRIGKFKPPLGLERLQTDSNLLFAERSLASDLIPQRDTGLEFFGAVWNDRLAYQASFTNGVADGAFSPDSDTNNAKVGSFRVFAKPWGGLGIGVAGSYTGDNTLIPAYKTSSGQETFFSYASGTSFVGEQSHIIPQATYFAGPLGLQAEYAETSQVAQTGRVRTRLTNHAWQTAASWVLTGENASYTGVAPAKPFDPKAGTWGAWELAARLHQLQIDPDTFDLGYASRATSASKATAYTVGLNWYLNKFVKLVADYEQTWFNNGNGSGDRPIERVFDTRWQVAF